ncbi:MAG: hypothetical protein JST92_21815 [Deltaproteobacteria bacterium]|nr:hypothetical protein [Deltaproteobacteria bacterium]
MPDDRYDFEEGHDGRRDAERATAYARKMLDRLKVSHADQQALFADHAQERHLVEFALEVHLNIAWYARKMKQQETEQTWSRVFIVAFGLFGISAIPIAWYANRDSTNWNAIFLQLTALPAAGFGVLRMLSSLMGTKSLIGSFWRARAELGELLYTVEQKWTGQVATARLVELWTDLDAGTAQARHITREERQRFFDSMQTAGDVLAQSQQVFDDAAAQFRTALGPAAKKVAPKDAVAEAKE